jgi:hypothetical protein
MYNQKTIAAAWVEVEVRAAHPLLVEAKMATEIVRASRGN